MSKQLWFEGLSHSIGQVEENKEEPLSASLYPQYLMQYGASSPFLCPSSPLPFLTDVSSCSCWKIEKVSERAVAPEILKQKCHVQIPLTLGTLSSSPGTALLSAACLHRLCIRSAKIAMWEWGRAQITLIPLSSHSSAIPKAFTLQQHIPLEGSSHRLSVALVAGERMETSGSGCSSASLTRMTSSDVPSREMHLTKL